MSPKVTPFIMLNGNAREAIRFYESALGARIVFSQTYGEAPDLAENPVSAEAMDRVTHSVLKIGEAELFVADSLPEESHHGGERVQICITSPDVETSERYFDALQQGGKVILPLRKIYFSPAYGVVTDRFGVIFQIFTQR